MATLVRTIFAQPDAELTRAQHARVMEQLEGQWPDAARLLAETRDELLAFTAWPKEHGRQIGSNNPRAASVSALLQTSSRGVGGSTLKRLGANDRLSRSQGGAAKSRYPFDAVASTGYPASRHDFIPPSSATART